MLDEPIGSGKSTLGAALADAINGAFIDGDDFAEPGKPWCATALSTSQAIVRAAYDKLEGTETVIVAHPVRCVNWIFFRRRFAERMVRTLLIGLHADHETIIAERRGRNFSADEKQRIGMMIHEGYGRRLYSDHILEVSQTYEENLSRWIGLTRAALSQPTA